MSKANPYCLSSVLFKEDGKEGENKFCIIEDWSNEEECDKDCAADYVKEYVKQMQESVNITIKKLKPI